MPAPNLAAVLGTLSLLTGVSACSPTAPTISPEQARTVAAFEKTLNAGDALGAAAAFRSIRQRWPHDVLNIVPPGDFIALDMSLISQVNAQYELELYLDSVDGPSSFGWADMDGVWLRLAVKLAEAGDQAGAERVLLKITDPSALAEARADRRFDAIVAAHPDHFDVDKVMAERIARVELATRLEPARQGDRQSFAWSALGANLDLRGDDVAAGKAYAKAFGGSHDPEVSENGAIHASNIALNQGRLDEAYKIIVDRLDQGQRSQRGMIWVARIELARGQPLDALQSLSGMIDSNVERLPPTDRMEPLMLEVCAAKPLGEALVIKRVLAYMDARADDGPREAIDAHLCAGDLDGAAALAIRYLNAPYRRHAVLIQLQDWAPPPYQPRWLRNLDDAHRTLRERPDVAAALAKVGRVQAYHVRRAGGIV